MALQLLTGVNMKLTSDPAYSCCHSQLPTPRGQAHWAGWGCCQSAGGKRHCQVSLTLLAASPISLCHCQEAGRASSQCQRPTGCSLSASSNSLRQCQHQLALGAASFSEPAVHCQLCFDFHLSFSCIQGLNGAAWACCDISCVCSACCIWPKSKGSCLWDIPPSCSCPWWLTPCWLWLCPWSAPSWCRWWWPWVWSWPWPKSRGWKPLLSPWWPWPWWCPWWWPCPWSWLWPCSVSSSTAGVPSAPGCASALSLHSSGISALCKKIRRWGME